MDDKVCGLTNWHTFIISLWADCDPILDTQRWLILDKYGDKSPKARPLLKVFYQQEVYPFAQKKEEEKVNFFPVNWDEIITNALDEWATEKQYYQEETNP